MHALSAGILRADHWPILDQLNQIPPASLADAIPEGAAAQDCWLHALARWSDAVARLFDQPGRHFAWAARALRDRPPAELAGLEDIADFLAEPGAPFSPDWTYAEAKVARQRYGRYLVDGIETFNCARPLDEIDYGWFPVLDVVAGHTFVALRSRAALEDEGAAMRHCVATYFDQMESGRSRLYSVRRGVIRVATLELTRSGRLAQLCGPRNAKVDHRVADAAAMFAYLVQVAVERKMPAREPHEPGDVGQGRAAAENLLHRLERLLPRRRAPRPADPIGRGTILVADDDADFRRLCVRFLTPLGFAVCEAVNGFHALQLMAAEFRIDLVITGDTMPVMRGWDLVRELMGSRLEVPVAFVTTLPNPTSRTGPGSGRFRMLSKPVGRDELIAAVEALVRPPSGPGAP